MSFDWKCDCEHTNTYKGKKTTDANSTCSNCSKTQRIWKLKIPTKSNNNPTNSNNIPTPQYTTSIINRPSKIQIAIDDVSWLVVLEVMDRGISTIRNKSEVKNKKGSYYYDFLKWTVEFKKIEAIAEVMQLMEGK